MPQLTLFETVKPKQRRAPRPSDPHVTSVQEQKRLTGQNLAIIERLKSGPATNVELSAIALRYGARLKDIKEAGHQIERESLGGGVHLYKLIGEPR